MSNDNIFQSTQHAFLVAWGWFAEHVGLPEQIEAVGLKQKHYHHRPQTKVLEFLVSIMAGSQSICRISVYLLTHWTRIRLLQKPGGSPAGLVTAV